MAKGLSIAEAGMFFVISWRWVVKVVADIRTMRTIVTIFVLIASLPRKVSDSRAPKIEACSACDGDGLVDRPDRVLAPRARRRAMLSRPLRTWNSPKKNGDCARIGRHEEKGLVPSFLYSSIVSAVIAWRDSGSLLPLYFFWIFCSSGWIICILREAMICLKNSGIITARITRTRPTIDSAQVQPGRLGQPQRGQALRGSRT